MALVTPNADADSSQAPRSASANGLTTPLLVVAALTAAVSFIICLKIWLGSSTASPDELLRMANRQYSVGNLQVAGGLALRAELPEDADPELVMQRNFFIGAGYARQAIEGADASTRRAAVPLAVEYLLLASAGWPTGREDDGNRLLGQMFYQAGEFSRAVPPLQALVERNPAYGDAVTPSLVRCLLRGNEEAVRHGLRLVDERLEAPIRLAATEQELEHLRAECLTRLSRYDAAREQLQKTLAKRGKSIGDDETAVTQLSTELTELLLAAVDVSEAVARFGPGSLVDPQPRPDAEQFLAPALQTLWRLQRDASPPIAVRTGRWIARGLFCIGNPEDALSHLSAVRLQQPFEGEAIAAGVEEVEHLIAQGSNSEALQTVRHIITEIGSEANYDPSVIELYSFRQRLQNVLTLLRDRGDTQSCVDIARALTPLFSRDHALFEEGLALREAADKLADSLQVIGNERQRSQSIAVRALYGQAGNAFEAAARLRYESASYSETLWEAIDAFQQSRQFTRSVDLLTEYLRYEQRIRHPRALIAQGRVLLAGGSPAAAIKPLMECVEEFPRDPLCYDARLWAARALAELDELEQAKQLLDINLTDGALTPQSVAWKDSLLALGEILWRRCHESHARTELKSRLELQPHPLTALRDNQARIDEAITRLRESVIRYWPDPQAMRATALLAKANRLAAKLPQAEAEVPDMLEATRRRLLRQREQFLQNALEGHRQIRKELARFEDERTLELAEQLLLQAALMGEADTLFELRQFEQSADAYRTISLRYMNEPPALEAMLGQSRCLSALNRPREARLVIRQAAMVLGRIPSEWDDRFEQTTRYDRKRWEDLLAWMDSGPMPQGSDT